jgi:hypothetical protein
VSGHKYKIGQLVNYLGRSMRYCDMLSWVLRFAAVICGLPTIEAVLNARLARLKVAI